MKDIAGAGVKLRHIYSSGGWSHHPNHAPQHTNANPNYQTRMEEHGPLPLSARAASGERGPTPSSTKIEVKRCRLPCRLSGKKGRSSSLPRVLTMAVSFYEVVKWYGFIKSFEESCLYEKNSSDWVAYMILCVDDILLMRNDLQLLQSTNKSLKKCF